MKATVAYVGKIGIMKATVTYVGKSYVDLGRNLGRKNSCHESYGGLRRKNSPSLPPNATSNDERSDTTRKRWESYDRCQVAVAIGDDEAVLTLWL